MIFNKEEVNKMRKVTFLISVFLLQLTFTGCSIKSDSNKNQSQPNILFIFTDDHAMQSIGAYGSIINETPNLDRIANEGIMFTNATVTNSICGPSRAVILTGKHSHKNGFYTNEKTKFDGSQQTFPKLLQNAGYETALFGKWHLGSEPTGFDAWKVLPGQGNYYNPDFISKDGEERVEGYVTDIVTDMSIEWLKNQRNAEKPFLLMCQHKAPHRRWMPALRHLDLYKDVTIPEPPTLFDDYSNRNSGASTQEMEIGEHMSDEFDLKLVQLIDSGKLDSYNSYLMNAFNRMTPDERNQFVEAYREENEKYLQNRDKMSEEEIVRWKYQRYLKDYLRCIAAVDENIGRLLDYLEESGLANNTIVVYSSDQGFYLGEHGWFDKRWMYKESFGTPLMIKWPGHGKPGTVNNNLVQNLDYAETFLEMAGVEMPDDMQGKSLVPLINGENLDDWRDALFYHYYEFPGWHSVPRHYGISTKRFKLIHYYQLDEWELIDMEQDTQEMYNLFGKPGYKKITADLKKRLLELAVEYEDSVAISYLNDN